jgi:PAS domain S-box-containing protein
MHPGERQVEQALRAIHEATATATGEAYLEALVRALAEVLGASCCFLALLLPGRTDRVRTHRLWRQGRLAEPLEYDLAGTPCETLLSGGLCQHPAGVAAKFPGDGLLADLGAEAYLGIPLPGPGDRPRGLLAVLAERPMPALAELGPLLGLFAARAAAELDRIRSDEELRRSETLFRQIVTSCAEGVAVLDGAGLLTYCNQQLATILGYPGAEALRGVDLLSLVAPDDRAGVRARLASRSQGEAALYEFRVIRRGGGQARLLASSAPILDAQGRCGGAIALLTDVTERHALDEQVREAQKRESLGVLAGGVAHEFNNLLVGILANVAFAAAELPAGSEVRAAVEDARTAAQKASDLTRQLLAYSGRGKFTVGPVDLNALAGEMVALATPALQPRARVVTALAPALPEVRGDAGQLRQVVLSLVTNASDALQERPGTVTLRTGVERLERMALARFHGGDALAEGSYVVLQVEDDGAGMDEPTRARIFEPFFTTKFTGRGLGLPAAFGILKAHGGAIRVESVPGQGSTITVLLPPRVAAAPAAAPAHPASPAAAAQGGRPLVLVADDEEVVRRAARRALERAGFEVEEVGDGRQAVDRFAEAQGRIACVLLDLTMPGMGGEAALAAIRERSVDVPVVLTSGFSDRDEASAEASDPRVGFLPKPFGPSELVAAVRRAMSAPPAR